MPKIRKYKHSMEHLTKVISVAYQSSLKYVYLFHVRIGRLDSLQNLSSCTYQEVRLDIRRRDRHHMLAQSVFECYRTGQFRFVHKELCQEFTFHKKSQLSHDEGLETWSAFKNEVIC